MANGFGSLYVGTSGLQSAQNGLNVLSNNLANLGTTGYVRQQIVYQDRHYTSFQKASVSTQQTGTGVSIADVVHARDVFLDRSYRTVNGRAAFYAAGDEASSEIETQLQETNGEAFRDAVTDLYQAFAEYAKDPSSTVYQNLVLQKSELFLSRAAGVYDGLADYQKTLNTKIINDVEKINKLGKEIQSLNNDIQKIEAGSVETAMDLRDQRDKDLDELSGLASVEYSEESNGIVRVKIEGTEFLDGVHVNELGIKTDKVTGFANPYWKQLSDISKGEYYYAFSTADVDPAIGNDIGELKSLLLARGDKKATYMDISGLSSEAYDKGISNSIIMNSQAELDMMVNYIARGVNDLLSPNTTYSKLTGNNAAVTGHDDKGNEVVINPNTKVLDTENCSLGASGKLPPEELFVRNGTSRYKRVVVQGDDGGENTFYVYNEENAGDLSKCYTLKEMEINSTLKVTPAEMPHLTKNGSVDYTLGKDIYNLWETEGYRLNPSDVTPTTLSGFYAKYIGELATTGSVYKTTSEALSGTRKSVESGRQGVIGVSSDEELTNMIRFQNAYNASSRYINVVSQMIEYLLSSLGK